MGKLTAGKIMRIACLIAGIGGVLLAQGARAPAEDSSKDALLEEVRALRAEIRQATSAGIHMQLLVARLQLQDQRVVAVARQLADAQTALVSVQGKITGERARVRQLEDAESRATGSGRLALQQAIADAGTQIEQLQKQELQSQAREKELLRAVNDAQTRWTDFNEGLDAVERSLPASASR
jgi:hypothetical protein